MLIGQTVLMRKLSWGHQKRQQRRKLLLNILWHSDLEVLADLRGETVTDQILEVPLCC